MNKLGSAVGASLGALALATSMEAGAQSAETKDDLALLQANFTLEQVDCVTHVKAERDFRKAQGDPMTRREMAGLLSECKAANTDALIAQQETIIAAQRETIQLLEGQLAANNMRLDESGQILDEYNRVVAELVLVGDQLAIQRRTNENIAAQNSQISADITATKGRIAQLDAEADLLRADIAESQRNIDNMLDQAERILRSLSS